MEKNHKSYLGAIITAFILALIIPFALSAITNFNLVSPLDNFWTNDTTPSFNFSAISTTDATFSCSLYVNDTLKATNGAVANNTYTILTSSALNQGAYNWYINCTDTGGTFKSPTRAINIDTAAPSVTLEGPSNRTQTTSHRIDFEFKAIDNLASSLACGLYVDGNKEDDETAENNTEETFNNVDLDSGNHTWYVKCSDTAGNSGQSETRLLEIESYCDDGECGEIEINKVYDPDSDDDFYPGDNITVKIRVKNEADDDLDVTVEAELYDIDDDNNVIDDEETTTIEENDYETITLTLEIPYDVDESHDFIVRFKAYEDGAEDEHCDEDSIPVSIKKEKHAISIEKLELDQTTVPCGGLASLNLKIANIGRNDEDVKIEISSAFFNWTKSQFTLDEGDDYFVTVPIVVPQDGSEGSYTITTKIYYSYSSGSYKAIATSSKTITVQGNCPPEPAPDVSFSASQISDAFTGQSFRIKIAITNTGNVKTNYTISASGYEEWATLSNIDPSTITLNAGKTGYAYVSLKPDTNATGTNTFIVAVSFDSTTKEETVSVEVKKESKVAEFWDRFAFNFNRNWYWFALIILLIAVVVILAIILGKQHTRKRRSELKLRAIQEKLEKKLGKGKKK